MSGALERSPADIIRYLLIDLGLGTNPDDNGAWPIYVSQTPDNPDSAITVTDQTGRRDGRTQTDGEVQIHHGFQIAVRDANHEDGYLKANVIAVALDESVAQTSVAIADKTGTGSAIFLMVAISRTTDVIDAGKRSPTSKRNLFTINAVAAIRQTS